MKANKIISKRSYVWRWQNGGSGHFRGIHFGSQIGGLGWPKIDPGRARGGPQSNQAIIGTIQIIPNGDGEGSEMKKQRRLEDGHG